MELILPTQTATEDLAGRAAQALRPGDVLFLDGALGAGKSTFARALIRSLTGQPGLEVPSPTFTLVQTYDAPVCAVWHFDLYRITSPDEIWELGWEEALGQDILVVEWAARLGDGLAPPDRLGLGFAQHPETNGRIVTITPHGTWTARSRFWQKGSAP